MIAAAMLFATSVNADAQLSSVLGKVLGGSSSSSSSTPSSSSSSKLGSVASSALSSLTSGNSTLSTLAGVISSKLIPTSSQIVGTWAYQEPAIMFTSSNTLKSLASSAVSKSIEKKLQTYLTKIGISKGNLTIVFDEDKNFYIKKSSKQIASGTYTVNSSDITLTFKGKSTPCKVTPQLDNGTLVIVMDASKLKTFFQNLSSNVSQLSTITSLLKQVDGMKIGIRLSKQ